MTAVGILFIVIGLLAFVFSDQWLYRLLILSVPFSATVVLNVGSDANSSGVQLWMYFGTLWLLREFGIFCLIPHRGFSLVLLGRFSWIFLFAVVLFISLLMPIYINGSLHVASALLLDNSTTPLRLQSRNFTALLYVIFGALLSLFISNRMLRQGQFHATQKLYLSAGLITAILGLVEFFANLARIPSPTLLLRNSTLSGTFGEAILASGVARVDSVSTEPSIMAQFLITVLPLTLRSFIGRTPILSRFVDRFAFFLIILLLLLSTSTVGLVGGALFCLLAVVALRKLRLRVGRAIGYGLLGIITITLMAGALYLVSPSVQAALDEVILFKATGYSALERAMTIANAWSYFKAYPILGIGWGSVTSHDLFVMILSSSGLIGLTAFALMIWKVGRPLYRGIRPTDDQEIAATCALWLLAGTLLLLVSAVSEFPYVFGYMWVLLSMCIVGGIPDTGPLAQGLESPMGLKAVASQ